MTINTAALNEVANFLGATDKNTVFTAIIGALVKSGVDIKDAIELVFGAGAYEKMAGQIQGLMAA